MVVHGADQFAGADLIKGRRAHVPEGKSSRRPPLGSSLPPTRLTNLAPQFRSKPCWTRETRPQIRLASMAGKLTLHNAIIKTGPTVTDNGNLVLDCAFSTITNIADLTTELKSIPISSNTVCCPLSLTIFTWERRWISPCSLPDVPSVYSIVRVVFSATASASLKSPPPSRPRAAFLPHSTAGWTNVSIS